MWALADVVGLFSINVGPFSRNVGRRQRIFSANVGPNQPMLSGRGSYVLGPLQLPFGWDAAVAAAIMHADRWNAGQALMKSTNPAGWETLAAEMNLAEANHDAFTACREAAARTKKEQHCTIVVPAP